MEQKRDSSPGALHQNISSEKTLLLIAGLLFFLSPSRHSNLALPDFSVPSHPSPLLPLTNHHHSLEAGASSFVTVARACCSVLPVDVDLEAAPAPTPVTCIWIYFLLFQLLSPNNTKEHLPPINAITKIYPSHLDPNRFFSALSGSGSITIHHGVQWP